MNLAKLAVRHVLERVKILILGRYFDGAAPASRAVKEQAVRIRNFRPINIDRVIVKALVQRPCVTGPRAVLILRKRAAISETHPDALGFGCNDTEFHAAFRIDLRILFARLVGWRGFPIINRWFVFGRENLAAQNRSECKEREFCFPGWFRF